MTRDNTSLGDRMKAYESRTGGAAQREVIHAEHRWRRPRWGAHSHQDPQHRRPRDSHAQPGQHGRPGAAGHDHRQVTDKPGQLAGPPRPPTRQPGNLFPECAPWTGRGRAEHRRTCKSMITP
jgi:hypothetical protein